MEPKSENIFFRSRLKAGFKNRTDAAEQLHISYDSLADYETGATNPSEDMVFSMSELYRDSFLVLEHFRQTRTGKLFEKLFNFQIYRSDLPTTTLGFMKEFNDIDSAKLNDFIAVVHDGVIDSTEVDRVRNFTKEVAELICQGMNLICMAEAKEKATLRQVA